jgi:beta propeller repeat protein
VATGTSAKIVTDQADIRVRDLDTGQDRRLTDTSSARSPDVSGDLAVWSELGDDGRWSIVVYDLEDRSVVRRIDRDGNQQFPAISGHRVVWQDSRRGNWDIRAYDLDERREFWVSDSSQEERNPSIDGSLVAFERDGLIWYRDLVTNRLDRVPGVGGYEPSVSGDRIAFRSGGTRTEPRDASIYVFDRRDGSLVQVSSTLDARRGNPQLRGDLVVWWDRRNGHRDVYAYDLAAKLEFAIAAGDDDQDQPSLTTGSPYLVVWTDWRGGDADIRGARVSSVAAPAEPVTTPVIPVVPVVPEPIAVDPNPVALRDARYFSPTGFRIDDDGIWEYFQIRGGVKNFGYPTSRTFTFLGYTTQFFQRHIVQVGPEGPRLMNLLDPELMPYTQINTSTFPAYDPNLANQAPPVGSPGYDRAIVDFVSRYAPDEYAGQPVRFFQTFASQVDLATAFPNGNGNPDLLPGVNLELAGAVTSLPFTDPNNPSFVYQRFQRVILHYDAASGSTQPVLLADYFKAILTGESLPPDLAEQASSSRFFMQYNPAVPLGLNRPEQVPGTDMLFAFERH